MTDLNLLSCTSRKDKTDSDLIRNAVLLWNNVVLCVIFKRKRVRFWFLRQYAVFYAVLKSIDDLFFLCEFALRFINQITVWIDDSFFCVDELSFHHRFWPTFCRLYDAFSCNCRVFSEIYDKCEQWLKTHDIKFSMTKHKLIHFIKIFK